MEEGGTPEPRNTGADDDIEVITETGAESPSKTGGTSVLGEV